MAGAFLYDNLIPRAVSVTAENTAEGAGVSNLLDPQLRLRMRIATFPGIATILVDFGIPRALDCVAVLSTSVVDPGATVRVRLSTTDPTGLAGDAWDTGVTSASTGAEASGNVIVVRAAGPASGRYLWVQVVDGVALFLDIGHLAVGTLWRLTRAQSYGAREGRMIMDRRDRNDFTGAEFPVPALLNPRFVIFAVQNMTRAEIEGPHRDMTRVLGAAGDALWIPDLGLSAAEINRRSIWGAVARPGDDIGAERTNFVGWTRAWRLIERG